MIGRKTSAITIFDDKENKPVTRVATTKAFATKDAAKKRGPLAEINANAFKEDPAEKKAMKTTATARIKTFNNPVAPAATNPLMANVQVPTAKATTAGVAAKRVVAASVAPVPKTNILALKPKTAPTANLVSYGAMAPKTDDMIVGPSATNEDDPMQIEPLAAQGAWEDIDLPDIHDTQFVTEYVKEIYEYLRSREVKLRVTPDYITKQPDINTKMRSILVDWLGEVHQSWKLLTETLFMAVYVLDKFLSLKNVSRGKLQLAGVASLLIGCKFEEIYPPEIRDLVYITDSAYEKEEIIQMEWQILTTLKFELSVPNALHFLRRYSKANVSDSKAHTLSKYLLELCLVEYKMLNYLPSQLAATAVLLTNKVMGKTPAWTPTLSVYSKYTEESLQECLADMHELHYKACTEPTLHTTKKYSSPKFFDVGKMSPAQL